MKNKFLKWYLVGFLLILTNKLIGNSEVIFSFLVKLKEILSPFIFGIIIAYILSGVMKKVEKKFNLKRGMAFALTYLIFLALLIFSLATVFPVIIGNIVDLTNKIPNYTYDI